MIRRHWVLLAVVPLTLAAMAGAGALAVAYDRSSSQRLMPGTFIEGIPVGGLRFDDAVRVVRERLEAPLHQPLEVEAEHFEARTSPWDLGYRIDVRKAVRQAMGRSDDGNIVTRLWKRTFNSATPAHVSLKPAWGKGAIDSLLDQASTAVGQAPKDADIDISTGWVQMVPARAGRALEREQSKKALVDAVSVRDAKARLVTRPVAPAETLAHVILVRTGENRLYLYRNGTIVKSWPVATGSGKFPSPTGIWRVTSKQVNPVWINPGSDWAKAMPARIGPGPRNPLGTRALALNAPGILIHATSDVGSIGYSVSHGCIRMTEADEKELFGMVPVGTRVAIVNAGPPKPRTAAPRPAPTPVDIAAVEF